MKKSPRATPYNCRPEFIEPPKWLIDAIMADVCRVVGAACERWGMASRLSHDFFKAPSGIADASPSGEDVLSGWTARLTNRFAAKVRARKGPGRRAKPAGLAANYWEDSMERARANGAKYQTTNGLLQRLIDPKGQKPPENRAAIPIPKTHFYPFLHGKGHMDSHWLKLIEEEHRRYDQEFSMKLLVELIKWEKRPKLTDPEAPAADKKRKAALDSEHERSDRRYARSCFLEAAARAAVEWHSHHHCQAYYGSHLAKPPMLSHATWNALPIVALGIPPSALPLDQWTTILGDLGLAMENDDSFRRGAIAIVKDFAAEIAPGVTKWELIQGAGGDEARLRHPMASTIGPRHQTDFQRRVALRELKRKQPLR